MPGYILDTNVLRELYNTGYPNKDVVYWVGQRNFSDLYITVLNISEIRYGIEILPDSRKRTSLEDTLRDFILVQFDGRILNFDLAAADKLGHARSLDKKRGRPRPVIDAMLGAIAQAHNLGIVTRNVRDFAGLDIELVNPWN